MPAAIHPRVGGFPVVESARADYFDALFHCKAVVGLNTSALIEASILGKRCFTLGDTVAAQEGTLHFQHLTNGGILDYAPNLQEHLHRLSKETENVGSDNDDIRNFVRNFLRPQGLAVPATPLFIRAIEDAFSISCEEASTRKESLALKTALHFAKLGVAGVGLSDKWLRRVGRLWARAQTANRTLGA
jgi:hypothetical protein